MVVESGMNKNKEKEKDKDNFVSEDKFEEQSDSLNFLFCNSKSIQLFGYDFSVLD